MRRQGGHVAKLLGDGVLAYFGWPEAHEDDAERAVRAGLAAVEAVAGLRTAAGPLAARVGIATGSVVVGEVLGEGEARERGVLGETPNLAARLQALAEPGAVVVGPTTRALLGDLFEWRDLGAAELRGLAEPVRAWQVLRPSAVASRFEALHAAATLTPLVGRQDELGLLQRRWRRARAGEGQVVLLSGEPGIGKSRLAAAWQERLEGEPHLRMRHFCSPQHAGSALFPVIGRLERAAGFAREDTAEAKGRKLRALLARTATAPRDVALLAELLSLPADPDLLAPLSPQRRREETLAALLRQLEALARQRPVLMVFEDAHWIDPTSRELLDLTVERVQRLPVLLLVTFRPEFQPPWVGQPHVTLLSLGRLGSRDGAALVGRVAAAALPAGMVEEIVERADGVPLFLEELTRAVLEAGAGGGRAALAAVPRPSVPVPATLHASLMARLDRLGPAKQVAQVGAAIGREFPYELLAAVAPLPEAELRDALERLAASGLVHQRGAPPEPRRDARRLDLLGGGDVGFGGPGLGRSRQALVADDQRRRPRRRARHRGEAAQRRAGQGPVVAVRRPDVERQPAARRRARGLVGDRQGAPHGMAALPQTTQHGDERGRGAEREPVALGHRRLERGRPALVGRSGAGGGGGARPPAAATSGSPRRSGTRTPSTAR